MLRQLLYFAAMKSKLALIVLAVLFLGACTNDEKVVTTSESEVDAARNFIRASLDNNFDEAKNYILIDSTNTEYLEAAQRNRAHLSKEDNLKYREASIQIYDTKKVADSASIVIYSNSYKNQKDSLKVVRSNGQWLIDFKYSFPGGIR
ncbi:MAG: hypothetical protein JWP69_951 [Flaviaesturariibacter sp.]|nr:hypothetical protein [Flaviaesturariibacter sp.]